MTCHPDGSLLATGDLNGISLLWDLRSGKCLMNFTESNLNAKVTTAMQFLPSGYHLAIAGDSNCISFWDLRKKAELCIVPAGDKLISDIKFEQSTG